jgi:Cu-Zn family superoxide dismutase
MSAMNQTLFASAFAAGLLAFAASAFAAQTATTELKTAAGASAGTATLSEAPKGVLVKIEARGLAPGWHAVHFHEVGDCSKSDFTSAGGHVHLQATHVHGLLNPAGNEAGDLPNIFIGANGEGSAEFFSTTVSLNGAEGRAALLDKDGSAVVVHASPDDYTSQPIGGAGPRVACGVIR